MNATTASALYESDFYGWTQRQADAIRSGRLVELDLGNLLEEIETMGRSERRSLESSLSVLLMHLLKWSYQPDYRSRSWTLTIQEQRIQARRIVKSSSSLKHRMEETIAGAWEEARVKAEKETGINQATFPGACPWSWEHVIDDAFWPDVMRVNNQVTKGTFQ